MRTAILLAGATLAMAVAAPRAGLCASPARSGGHAALVLSVAIAGTRSPGSSARLRELRTLLDLAPSAGQVLETLPAAPRRAPGIALSDSELQLSVAPTCAAIGTRKGPGFGLSGRF